ncbi:hypothetical protein RND71_039959 [Anisodus tanguticus]|uniref:Uncharacterized protein n=1 Tax=Anisodus tanguticus TaxID=243964 RepID=A0AAE1QXR8_9SOLA|nr:hypothetical protein RND71_039959 [Anisodus tanguticus]
MKVTEMCDVYSFGVLALEIIKGKHLGEYITLLANSSTRDHVQLSDLLDERLPYPEDEAKEVLIFIIKLASSCLLETPKSRPTMHFISHRRARNVYAMQRDLISLICTSGGVATMKPFLEKFFPSILKKAAFAGAVYCVYDSEVLTSFTSSLYIAGLVASLIAGRIRAAIGRRNIMATPVYLSEMAPSKWRDAFSTGFQFFIGLGVVTANCINYGTSKVSWGWRLSLGLAVVPSATMIIGALLIFFFHFIEVVSRSLHKPFDYFFEYLLSLTNTCIR